MQTPIRNAVLALLERPLVATMADTVVTVLDSPSTSYAVHLLHYIRAQSATIDIIEEATPLHNLVDAEPNVRRAGRALCLKGGAADRQSG